MGDAEGAEGAEEKTKRREEFVEQTTGRCNFSLLVQRRV